jgi:hypothetical protein
MAETELSYAGVVTRLRDLQGRAVTATVRDRAGSVGLCLAVDGELHAGSAGVLASLGYPRDTAIVFVGDAVITLHAARFASGAWDERDGESALRVVLGEIELAFRLITTSAGSSVHPT